MKRSVRYDSSHLLEYHLTCVLNLLLITHSMHIFESVASIDLLILLT